MPRRTQTLKALMVISFTAICSQPQVTGANLPPYPSVEKNGKRYAVVSGKLYPMKLYETRFPDGRINTSHWVIDYSSYVPPTVNINIPPPVQVPARPRGDVTQIRPALSPANDQPAATRPKPAPINVREVGSKRYITLAADVLFEFDKHTLTPEAEEVLSGLVQILRKYTAISKNTIIEGHTDSVGEDEYNQQLSERRAQTVKEWLTAHSVVAEPVTTVGCGERSPVAPNAYNDGTDFPAGRAKNRRVEIIIDTAEPVAENSAASVN